MSPSLAYLNIPEELTNRKIWTLWRYEDRDGKPTKVPYIATRTAVRAKVNDPTTWSTFDQACLAYDDDQKGAQRFDGLMFAMTADDEIVGIDFDHCFVTRGGKSVPHPVVTDFIESTSSYAEITPSGEGVRVLITAPGGKPEWSKHKATIEDGSPGVTVEVYDDKRFFTITGYIMQSIPAPIKEAEAELVYLCEHHLRKPVPVAPAEHTAPRVTVTDDDHELLSRIERSAKGDKFMRLYTQGVSTDDDDSVADFSLCCTLAFWTQRDAGRMDRLFRSSALMRAKWNEPRRVGETYGQGTITRAIAATHRVYDPGYNENSLSSEAAKRLAALVQGGQGDEHESPGGSTSAVNVVASTLPPWPVMGLPAHRGVLGDYIKAVSPFTEADDAGVLLHLLAMAGRMIGPDVLVEFGAEKHPAKVWPLVVGDTSRGRKGTAEGVARRLFERVHLTRPMPFPEANISSGEALIWAVRDDRAETGKDGKEHVVPGVADKRQLFIESEFASPLRVARRESSILSGVMRQAWGQDSLSQVAKKEPANCASGAHISIIGHITPDELRKEMRALDLSNGFLNRFLLCMVRRARHLPLGPPITDEMVDPFVTRIVSAVDKAWEDAGSWALDEPAARLYTAWYDWNSRREDMPQRVSDLMARAEAYIPRLALIYAVLDSSRTIQAMHIESALAIVEYAEDSAGYLFGDGTTAQSVDERLLAWLTEIHPEPLSRTEITRADRSIKAHDLDDAVSSLTRRGLIATVKQPPTGTGRPATCYQLLERTPQTDTRPRTLADTNLQSADGDHGGDGMAPLFGDVLERLTTTYVAELVKGRLSEEHRDEVAKSGKEHAVAFSEALRRRAADDGAAK
jgi:hypothetical protein